MTLETILSAFEEALELERELGTRTVEIDRALLRSEGNVSGSSGDTGDKGLKGFKGLKGVSEDGGDLAGDKGLKGLNGANGLKGLNGTNGLKGSNGDDGVNGSKGVNSDGTGVSAADARADFAFLLECEPEGPVAELLPKMSEAIGYGPNGVKINDPSARVLIVMGREAMAKWLPGVKARPGQWVQREGVPALITASPTKTYRFFGHDPAKIRALKLRLWADLKAALARLGKTPPGRA